MIVRAGAGELSAHRHGLKSNTSVDVKKKLTQISALILPLLPALIPARLLLLQPITFHLSHHPLTLFHILLLLVFVRALALLESRIALQLVATIHIYQLSTKRLKMVIGGTLLPPRPVPPLHPVKLHANKPGQRRHERLRRKPGHGVLKRKHAGRLQCVKQRGRELYRRR